MIGDMYIHDHEAGSEIIIANHELFIVDFLMKNVKDDSNFMDIGGYEGYYTLLMGKKINKGTIYTFEPCAGSYEIIKKNVDMHSLNNVKLYHVAIGNKRSNIILYWRPGAQCVSRTFDLSIDNNFVFSENIPTVCLDDFDEKIDLIKIDIEGAEVELFQGAKKFFSRNKDCKVVLELHCSNIKARSNVILETFVNYLRNRFNLYNFDMIKMDENVINKMMTYGGHLVLLPK